MKWTSARLELELAGKLRDTRPATEDPYAGILPSKLAAAGSITYNLNHRLFAGVTAEYSSEREGYFLTGAKGENYNAVLIPSYVDLGCNARFDFSSSFTVWGRVSNLLNHNVQRSLGHSYDGIYITGGICLNF
jgi:outer membrane receptor for ferrienterochelin and colicin